MERLWRDVSRWKNLPSRPKGICHLVGYDHATCACALDVKEGGLVSLCGSQMFAVVVLHYLLPIRAIVFSFFL